MRKVYISFLMLRERQEPLEIHLEKSMIQLDNQQKIVMPYILGLLIKIDILSSFQVFLNMLLSMVQTSIIKKALRRLFSMQDLIGKMRIKNYTMMNGTRYLKQIDRSYIQQGYGVCRVLDY